MCVCVCTLSLEPRCGAAFTVRVAAFVVSAAHNNFTLLHVIVLARLQTGQQKLQPQLPEEQEP